MRAKKFIFPIIILLAIALSAVWGLSAVRGQIPLREAPVSGGQYAPAEDGTPETRGPSLPPENLTTASLTPESIPTVLTPLAEVVPTVESLLEGGETVVAVGDIGTCSRENDDAVAALARDSNSLVLLLGDNVYERGSTSEYTDCFDPAWGSFKDRLKPVPGNHEYKTGEAAGYYQYFGAAAGDPSAGYYSFNQGSWHLIALNSNCDDLTGGCEAGSPQETWLRADLAANPSLCTLAYWHHPLFSSGDHGDNSEVKPLWDALYAAGVDLILNGHDHNYERFAPQDPAGQPDPARGIREFVVGTGGKSLRSVGGTVPNSELDSASSYGLLKLTLSNGEYGWEFLPAAGGDFTDSGQAACH